MTTATEPETVDFTRWEFSVIYAADFDSKVHGPRTAVYPPHCRKLWQMTESGRSEYDNEYDDNRPFRHWRHRKWGAILTYEQFKEFLDCCCLGPDRCKTMGSIGAPGFGIGWAPAISFGDGGCDQDSISNAYVTPIPPDDFVFPAGFSWDKCEEAAWEHFA